MMDFIEILWIPDILYNNYKLNYEPIFRHLKFVRKNPVLFQTKRIFIRRVVGLKINEARFRWKKKIPPKT